MDTIKAFGVIAEIYETSYAAIQMSRDGESDYQRWMFACRTAATEHDLDMDDGKYMNASWRAYVNLTMIGQ